MPCNWMDRYHTNAIAFVYTKMSCGLFLCHFFFFSEPQCLVLDS